MRRKNNHAMQLAHLKIGKVRAQNGTGRGIKKRDRPVGPRLAVAGRLHQVGLLCGHDKSCPYADGNESL